MANGSPGVGGVFARIVAALLLVYATYNPEGVSYFHWAIAPLLGKAEATGSAPLKFLAGIGLATGWVIFLTATRRSIGWIGATLVLALAGGVVWLLIDAGVASARSARGIAHIVLICTAIVLGAGMTWSHVSRRLSGQTDTDIVN
ncbi:MAG: DUF6524 family protein [Gemmatimonadaceae bacterium]|jgi:hypothetical protein|nr:DUF6524 family protein [Gemmatimonadaceae bacterium]